MPIETFLLALTTFFATIGPADLVLVYAALTQKNTRAERRMMALRGVAIAAATPFGLALSRDGQKPNFTPPRTAVR